MVVSALYFVAGTLVMLAGTAATVLDRGRLELRSVRGWARLIVYVAYSATTLLEVQAAKQLVGGDSLPAKLLALLPAVYAPVAVAFDKPREVPTGVQWVRPVRALTIKVLIYLDRLDAPVDDVLVEWQRDQYAAQLFALWGARAADELLDRYIRGRFEDKSRRTWRDEILPQLSTEAGATRLLAVLDMLRDHDQRYYEGLSLRISKWQREMGTPESESAPAMIGLRDVSRTA